MRKLVLLLTLLSIPAFGQADGLNEKAAKYHALLLKRPKPGAIYERFASAWLEEGDIVSLRAFLEKRAGDPKATTADRLVYGFFLSQQSEHDAAISVFGKALDADPGNAEAWLLRAQTEARVGRNEEALKSLEHVPEGKNEAAADAAKLKARLLARTGKTTEALEVLKNLAAAFPEDEDLQDEVVELHLDEGLQGEAAEFLKGLLERTKDPYQRVLRRLRLGDILKRGDRRDEALAAYSQCLEDSAQDSWVEGEVLAQIEQTFRSKDDLTGLKDFLAKVSEKHERRLALGQLRSRVLLDLNESDAALTLYREMVGKNPGNVSLKEAFIDVLARVQKFDEAVVQCRELLAQRAGDKELRIHLATLLYQARQPGAALKELEPLISDPKTPEFEVMRVARLYESFEDPEQARKLYQRAVNTYPDSITAQDALASFMHAHNEKISAVTLWRKQAVAPAVKDEVMRVARALASRGESKDALEVLQAREQEFPNDVPYLTQLIAAANSAQMQHLASGWALTLVKLAKDGETLEDALRVARPVFRDPKQAGEVIKSLRAVSKPGIQEICLLADLLEQNGDPEGADKVLAAVTGSDLSIARREQARLYLFRQDYEKAAATLEQVAAEQKDAGVVQQIVELYQRAARNELALKWIAEWKQLMPGSTRPWLAEARALQSQQKMEEAVKVLKQAARKYADDVSMSTALADAYNLNDQAADAQRIYQKLYDDAEDLPAQIRWAGQLAESAQRRGTIKELLESFQERQRGNRTSIAPWLAIAEIHRRTSNYEGRRTALLEASRLKPKDVDLLHQLARSDEDQGDWRKAIESLTLAAALDKTTKSKQRMVEVHLRYGDEETGLRMAFELGGGAEMDPRDAEGMVVGLMTRGNWAMAQQVLNPVLTRHADDYRLRYLKVLCLIEDEKTDDAINEAVILMGARVEVLTPSVSKSVTAAPSLTPEQMDPIDLLVSGITGWGSMALRYRDDLRMLAQSNRYYFSSASGSSQYNFMPSTVSVVKPMVTALLIRARQDLNWSAEKVADVVRRVSAAGHPLAEAIQWFEVGGRGGQNLTIILAEVEKNIGNVQLVGLWMNQVQGRSGSMSSLPPQLLMQLQSKGVNLGSLMGGGPAGSASVSADSPEKKLLGRIYDHYLKSRPLTAATAAMRMWQMDSTDAKALDRTVELAATLPVKDSGSVYLYTTALTQLAGTPVAQTPMARKLRDAAVQVLQRYSDAHPAEAKWMNRVSALHAAVGDWDAFVTSVEAASKEPAGASGRSSFYFGGSVSIQPLNVYHVLSSLERGPSEALNALMQRGMSGSSMQPMPEDQAKALNAAAARLTDPGLRALIAWRTEDKAVLTAYAEAQAASSKPVLWPLLAMAQDLATEDPVKAASWLVKARQAGPRKEMVSIIDAALVSSVSGLMKEGKAEAAEPFRKEAVSAALGLRRAMATGYTYEIEQLAGIMDSLGMKEEAERQRKAIAATRAQRTAVSRTSGPTSDPYQISNDLRNGKQATAIPQAVRALRTLAGTLATGSSSYAASYEIRRWTTITNDHPAAAEEIWKQLSSGEATTLKQKMERAVLADVLGHPEIAIEIYRESIKTRPRDVLTRLRLAILLCTTEEGMKEALEHLLVPSPADLGNEARSQNLTDSGSMSVVQRLNFVSVVIDYLRQVKPRAKSGDLEWSGRMLDLLMTGSWNNGPRMPSMLEEAPEANGAIEPLLARREKMFVEFCKVAVEIPEIAHHILPAQFALALRRKEPTEAIIKNVRQALAGLASVRNGGMSFSMSQDWTEGYSGSYSGRRIWVPMLPEILLYQASQQRQEKQFKDEIVPLIRQAYGPDAGNEYELRAKMWFCPEAEFAAVAKEALNYRQRSMGGSDNVNPAGVIRVWGERSMKVPLDDLVASYIKDQVRRNYGLDESVLAPYLAGLLKRGGPAVLSTALKSYLAAMLGRPEGEWTAFLEANPAPPPGGSTTQGSPQYRIRQVSSNLDSATSSSLPLRLYCIAELIKHDFHKHDSFGYLVSSFSQQSLPDSAADLMPALEAVPYLQDVKTFDVLERKREGYRSGFDQLADVLQRRGKDYSATLVEALQKRQEKKPTFGGAMLIGRLVELTPDLALTLQPYAQAFAGEPAPRQQMLLKVIRSVWTDFDRLAVRSPSLESFAAGLRAAALSGADKLLAAKETKDIEVEDSKFEKAFYEAVAQAVVIDPDKAGQAFEHGVKLMMNEQAKGQWTGLTWNNGCNIASGMIEKCAGAAGANALRSSATPTLEVIGMVLRVCEKPDQRLYLCTYSEPDFRWGEMMRVYWERSGGFGEPRQAVHKLLTELKRVLGTASPALLPGAFRAMAEDVPRWYRQVVLDEAAKVAGGKDAEAAIARELIAGFGLLSRDPAALEHLRQRANDKALHPLIRPVLAGLLVDNAGAELPVEEVRGYVELTLPLLENRWPAGSVVWSPIVGAFNRQPASPEWDALAKRLRDAWMDRAKPKNKADRPGVALPMQVAVTAHMLEQFARGGSDEELQKFCALYGTPVEKNVDSVLILARHDRKEQLKKVLIANDGSLSGATNTKRTMQFRSIDGNVTEVIDEAMKDNARLALRGRLLAVSAQDSTRHAPPMPRTARLKAEAERFVKDKAKDKLAGDPALTVLADSVASSEVLAPVVLSEIDVKAEAGRAARASGSTSIGDILDVPVALALAAYAKGDDKAWKQLLEGLKAASTSNQISLWNSVSYRAATRSVHYMTDLGVPKTPWVTAALRSFLDAAPDQVTPAAASGVHLISALLRNETKALEDWRKQLSKGKQKVMGDVDPLWIEYIMDAVPLMPGEDGGETLINLLQDPWAKAGIRKDYDLRYRGKWPDRLAYPAVRGKSQALLLADPGNLAVLTTVMDSWAKEKDQKPLLAALRAVKPKLSPDKDKKLLERIAAVESEVK